MNLLKEYLEYLLVEGRLEDLKAKYPNLDVDEVWKEDPSPTKKYAAWMLQRIANGEAEDDELGLYATVQFFDERKSKFRSADINAYKSYEDLYKESQRVKREHGTQSGRKQRETSKAGAVVIQDEENFTVYRIDTKEAAIIYGKNTQWCITQAEKQYYEKYKDAGAVFYYIISKVPKDDSAYEKVAIAVERQENKIEYFDSEDDNIDIGDIRLLFPELDLKKIKADAGTQPKPFDLRVKMGEVSTDELAERINSTKNDETIYRTLIKYINGPGGNFLDRKDQARSIRKEVAPNLTNAFWSAVTEHLYVDPYFDDKLIIKDLPPDYPNRIALFGYEWTNENGKRVKRADGGPSRIEWDGTKIWYDEEGFVHRDDDQPAYISPRYQKWFKHGKSHRVNGPAVLNTENDREEYYLNDKQLPRDEWEQERLKYVE